MKQTKTPEQFKQLNKVKMHQLWYHQALTDGQIADMYGVTKKEVKEKRKELGIGWLSSARLYLLGGPKFRKNDKSKVE